MPYKDKEKKRARNAAYHAAHKEELAAYRAAYRQKPEAKQKSRNRKTGQTFKAGKNYRWADVLELFGNKCAFCGTPNGKRYFYTDKVETIFTALFLNKRTIYRTRAAANMKQGIFSHFVPRVM